MDLAKQGPILERSPQQVREEGRGIVQAHLLVVQGQTEQAASQQLPATSDCRCRRRLRRRERSHDGRMTNPCFTCSLLVYAPFQPPFFRCGM